jgi:hypothetical protein
LRIGVDQEDVSAAHRAHKGHVNGDRSFAGATLLATDHQNHALSSGSGRFPAARPQQ